MTATWWNYVQHQYLEESNAYWICSIVCIVQWVIAEKNQSTKKTSHTLTSEAAKLETLHTTRKKKIMKLEDVLTKKIS